MFSIVDQQVAFLVYNIAIHEHHQDATVGQDADVIAFGDSRVLRSVPL